MKRAITDSLVAKIVGIFPQINPDYIFEVPGAPMFVDGTKVPEVPVTPPAKRSLYDGLSPERLIAIIELQQSQISDLLEILKQKR